MYNKDIYFPYYSGNIRLIKCIGHVNIDQFIKAHQTPTSSNVKLFEEIKKAKCEKEKRLLKHKLYSFTPSCYINKWDERKYDNIVNFTGLMQMDFDNINDPKISRDIKHWVFEQEETICSYYSPSGDVKALIRIGVPQSKEQYIRIHNAVNEKYSYTGYFDSATKNAVLPLFLSQDSGILYRDYSSCIAWIREKRIIVDHVALNEMPPMDYSYGSKDSGYNFRKTKRILERKIQSITSDGHTQLRSACLILGSRVGAGYMTKDDAEHIAISLIKSNDYLSKGTNGYIETALWCISQGINKPKYY